MLFFQTRVFDLVFCYCDADARVVEHAVYDYLKYTRRGMGAVWQAAPASPLYAAKAQGSAKWLAEIKSNHMAMELHKEESGYESGTMHPHYLKGGGGMTFDTR